MTAIGKDAGGWTPGPWEACGKGWEVTAHNGRMKVCDIRGWGYLTGKGARALPDDEAIVIQKANESLIAAAPELYTALRRLNELAKMPDRVLHEWMGAKEEADAALAKARGESA